MISFKQRKVFIKQADVIYVAEHIPMEWQQVQQNGKVEGVPSREHDQKRRKSR